MKQDSRTRRYWRRNWSVWCAVIAGRGRVCCSGSVGGCVRCRYWGVGRSHNIFCDDLIAFYDGTLGIRAVLEFKEDCREAEVALKRLHDAGVARRTFLKAKVERRRRSLVELVAQFHERYEMPLQMGMVREVLVQCFVWLLCSHCLTHRRLCTRFCSIPTEALKTLRFP